ncbi:hypothetical protein [Luteithermobacter gelatinilyticus]|uniref:BufA2 family periplasmic bufferin-type metallophore n=1 Tax=Luteithermobacter gelatinilyticus TaxID=2582913 RepID=UPI001AF02837|nr:hypothetical protein [Luteithermobacter gelatinilyticus]|tara:strand:+ start:7924 stop:8178 length:255 start_codon:yes stop_codon:yes gene_type:complete
MSTPMKTAGLAMAVAAAGFFAAAPATVTAGEKGNVKCYGVNACKGHNDCKGANNACAGHGSCKGQGFVLMSEDACKKVGGEVKK